MREVIRVQGQFLGMNCLFTPAENRASHTRYLEDLALRIICIFALDRFGDFGSDQVVAPVREVCGQVLGVVLKFMDADLVVKVLGCLPQLQDAKRWEVRHGGLLGLRYLLSVREDLTKEILPAALQPIMRGLLDTEDYVRYVAADALLPVCGTLTEVFVDKVPSLLALLWDTLLALDDLTVSTSSVLQLLSQLCLTSPVLGLLKEGQLKGEPLSKLVPRLWPFFRHNISAVRHAVLKTLRVLFELQGNSSWLEPDILQAACRHTFQNIILEKDATVFHESTETLAFIVSRIPKDLLDPTMASLVPSWLAILSTPLGLALPTSLFLFAVKLTETTLPASVSRVAPHGVQAKQPPINVDLIEAGDPKDFGAETIIRNRMAAAVQIAKLIIRLPSEQSPASQEIAGTLQKLLTSDWAFQRRMGAIVLQELVQFSIIILIIIIIIVV